MTRAAFTVLIPAHDEASVIARTLRALETRSDPSGDSPAVIVICNACTDATAAVARATMPSATVIETKVGGKANAINLGLAAAPEGAVIVLDADVVIDRAALDALMLALGEAGVAAASPLARFDLSRAPPMVRDYYRIFAMHRYQRTGVGGVGVYGLSGAGRERLGNLPLVLSDDDYVRHFFPLEQQRRVSVDAAGRPVVAAVKPPATLGALIRVESRWRAGDRAAGAVREAGLAGRRGDVFHAWRGSGAGLGALGSYITVKLSGRALLLLNRLRGRAGVWHRDDGSRAQPVVARAQGD